MKMFSLLESAGERKPSVSNENAKAAGERRKSYDREDKGDLLHARF